MKIAIAHYHLNRGGVTRVILNHLRALAIVAQQEPVQVLLLYGGRDQGWPDDATDTFPGVSLERAIVPGLEYDDGVPHDGDLADALQGCLSKHGFGGDATVLHVHNHALGKNVSLPGAISKMARRGQRCLLQVHDFAEDFRPTNFHRLSTALRGGQDGGQGRAVLADQLYPQSGRIHYAVLNGRDRGVLLAAGVRESRLHLLPNPVSLPDELPQRDVARTRLQSEYGIGRERRFVLYPVRGIRRKNLGEMLLLAALAQDELTCGVTLRPVNPEEARSYNLCEGVAEEMRLPVLFGMGVQLTFGENVAAADQILTTSVAEGFGMAFLESWLVGRPLFGRNLPEITADFRQDGLSLEHLYDRLDVPVDWIGAEKIRRCWLDWYDRTARAFGIPSDGAKINASIDRLLASGFVDFSQLALSEQIKVIRRVATDRGARDAVLQWNNKLKDALEMSQECIQQLVQRNQPVVRQAYSLEAAGRRLFDLYRAMLADDSQDNEIDSLPRGDLILKSFLDVSRLQPIRLE
jgi:glycosyltransferase involved in cell wall biosynthesis